MGRKKMKPSVYLTEQTTSQLKEVVEYLHDRVSEMEIDEEFMEEEGIDNIIPLLRGLVSFIREEHLEEDEDEDEDEIEVDDFMEDDDEELEF